MTIEQWHELRRSVAMQVLLELTKGAAAQLCTERIPDRDGIDTARRVSLGREIAIRAAHIANDFIERLSSLEVGADYEARKAASKAEQRAARAALRQRCVDTDQ